MSMSTPPSNDHMRRGDQEPTAAAHSGAVPTLHAAAAHRPPTDVQTCCVLMAARARPPRRSARSPALCAAAASAVRGCAGQSRSDLQSKISPQINRCPDREHAGGMPRPQHCQDQQPRGQAGQLGPLQDNNSPMGSRELRTEAGHARATTRTRNAQSAQHPFCTRHEAGWL